MEEMVGRLVFAVLCVNPNKKRTFSVSPVISPLALGCFGDSEVCCHLFMQPILPNGHILTSWYSSSYLSLFAIFLSPL